MTIPSVWDWDAPSQQAILLPPEYQTTARTPTPYPADFDGTHPVMAVACPACRARPGSPCKRPSGHRASDFHRDRKAYADMVWLAQGEAHTAPFVVPVMDCYGMVCYVRRAALNDPRQQMLVLVEPETGEAISDAPGFRPGTAALLHRGNIVRELKPKRHMTADPAAEGRTVAGQMEMDL